MKNDTIKTLFLAFFLVFTIENYSQTKKEVDTTKIAFIAYWAKGDNHKFKMVKSIERLKNDKSIRNDSIVYDAFFKVLDSTSTSYKISWKYNCDILYSLNLPERLKKDKKSITNIEVIYTTDETGMGVDIENWKTISDIYTKVINDVKSNLTAEEEKIYTSVLDPMLNALSKKEGIEEYCAKELNLFHFPFGVEFDPEEEITYDQIIPSPYSKEGLKAKTRVYFEDHNYKDSHCTFYSELNIDPDDSKKMITSLFKNMGIKDEEIKKQIKKSKYEINDSNRFDYIYNPGVPMYIINTRRVEIDIKDQKETRIDTIEIEFVEQINTK
jgi:hypothetical protein